MPARTRRTRSGVVPLGITLLVLLAISTTGALAQSEPSLDPASVSTTLFPGESTTITKTVYLPEVASPTALDIMFLSDTTGSMVDAISNVATNATSIMNTVLAAQPDSQFGAAQYKDVTEAPVFQVNQTITATVANVQTAISTWAAGGGGDTPEDPINALWQLAQPGIAGFRGAPASSIIVWFGDASSHDPSNGHSQTDAINALVAAGIKVLAINVDSGYADGLDADGQATSIATGSGGSFLGSATPDQVSALILSGLQSLGTSVSMASTCAAPISTSFSPTSQPIVNGQPAVFTETISVAADAAPGVYSCYDYALIDNEPMVDDEDQIIQETKTIAVPGISKTVATTFSRSWNWSIDKSVDQPDLWLDFWEPATVNYAVNVDGTAIDSNWNVSGIITVTNPATTTPLTVSLTDVISGGLTATISPDADCNLSGSTLTVQSNSAATCPYSRALPDGTDRTNTATMSRNGYQIQATAPVTFGAPNTITDECITIADSYEGNLGSPCVSGTDTTAHFGFGYDREIGPYPACYQLTVDNSASVTTNDTATVDSDSQAVSVTVHCIPPCCTQISSYWLQNSVAGSKRGADPTWYKIEPSGSATPFFLSPYTYRTVLLITPRSSDRDYYVLAQQYIAAELNLLHGSTAPWEVVDAMYAARDLFETYSPADVAAMGAVQRQQFTSLASTLYRYNFGYIGPGRCPGR